MKSLLLIIVLGVGVLAIMLTLVPVGTHYEVSIYPQMKETTAGALRIGEIVVSNNGLVSRTVNVPFFVACSGDRLISIDSYTAAGDGVIKGSGQIPAMNLEPGESGKIYLVASEVSFGETIQIFYDTEGFSCLTARNPVGSSR